MTAILSSIPEDFRSNFSKKLASELKDVYPIQLAGLPVNEIASAIQAKLSEVLPSKFSLVKGRPDFDGILVQLMNEVERSKAWADGDISATGQMILRAIAADVDYGQFSIARALQESFIDTARSDNSIYLAARMLGNRIIRNTPAKVTVKLERGDPNLVYEVDRYTQFEIDGTPYFNRYPIIFQKDMIELETDLYQGTVQTASIVSSGVPFQAIEYGFESWKASEVDLIIVIDGVQWNKVTDPLWHYYPEDKVFFENTLPNGNVRVCFGNNLTGKSPAINQIINVLWTETEGESGNDSRTGLSVKVFQPDTTMNNIEGITLTASMEGIDHKTSEFYKLFASNRRAAQQRAVRRSDYRAHAVEYSGVIDARFRGQAELNPNRPSWKNVIGVTLLTKETMTENQFAKFVEWMREEKGIFQCNYLRIDPEIIDITINATMYCRPEANLQSLAARHREYLEALFEPKFNSLGYSWYISDLHDALEGVGDLTDLIEYVDMSSPTIPAVCQDAFQWVRITLGELNYMYTRRGAYEGRLDRNPYQSDNGSVDID